MKCMLLVTSLVMPSVVLAGVEDLYGRWSGNDTAARSIYGTITITETHIRWGQNPNFPNGCETEYEVLQDTPVVVPGALDEDVLTNLDAYDTYVLFLKNAACRFGDSKWRLSFRKDGEKN